MENVQGGDRFLGVSSCGWAIAGTVGATVGLAIFGGGVGGFLFAKTIGTAGVIASCGD